MSTISLSKEPTLEKKISIPFDYFIDLIDHNFPNTINPNQTKNYSLQEAIPHFITRNHISLSSNPSPLQVVMPYRNVGIITLMKGQFPSNPKKTSSTLQRFYDRKYLELREIFNCLKNKGYNPLNPQLLQKGHREFVDPFSLRLHYDIAVNLDTKDRIILEFY